MSRKIWLIITLVLVALLALIAYTKRQEILALFFRPTESAIELSETDEASIEIVAKNLATPWSISFLPNGDMLVSERSGQMKRIGQNGTTYHVGGVRETSEGGLLGIALHPEFKHNQQLYIYFTTADSGSLTNQVDVVKFVDNGLRDRRTILDNIPAASNHNGGALEFGPDNKLYVTTGDAAQPDLAQDTDSLAGKILRLNDDGSTPSDNPFGNPTWSYGHRNPQGLAWDNKGQLWAVEHGPSGPETGRDELNLIEKGANYGWPVITGSETREGMESPVIQSGNDETWAPSRMAFLNGKLYFTGLRGESLYGADTNPTDANLKRYLTSEYGRLRAIAVHNGALYVGTSNYDGRGTPKIGDDRIIRIPLQTLRDGLTPQ